MNRYDYRFQNSHRAWQHHRMTQEILEEIQDDGGQPGSPNVYALDLSHLLAHFEQRIEALENKQESNND